MKLTKEKFDEISTDVEVWGIFSHLDTIIKDKNECAFMENVLNHLAEGMTKEEFDKKIKDAIEDFRKDIEEDD